MGPSKSSRTSVAICPPSSTRRDTSGADIRRSAAGSNVMGPTWLEAFRRARVYDLEQPRFARTPVYPPHRPGYFYALHRRHRDTYEPQAHGPRSGASGMLTMMEHTGTHIDALCHQAHCLKLFGGIPIEQAETPTGFRQLGIETVPPLVTR